MGSALGGSKRNLYIALAIISIIIIGGVAYYIMSTPSTPRISHIRFMGGVSGGGGYQFGMALIKVWQDKVPGITYTLEATQGFIDNAKKMCVGVGEFGVVSAGEALKMIYGREPYTNCTYKVYAVFPLLPPTYFHVIVLADSKIHSFSDLNGKRVNILTRGSLTEQLATQIFSVLGINIIPTYLTHTDAAIALSKGEIDAAATTTFASQYKELALSRKLRIISLTPEEVNKIKDALPHLDFEVFNFSSQYTDTNQALVPVDWTLIVARSDLPEDLAYTLVKTIYDNLKALIEVYPPSKDLKPELLLKASVPLHPGVVKYYSEKGIRVPEHLLPKK